MRRQVAAGAEPGRRTARSASARCGLSASASEYTATVPMPRSRQVRKTRRAISPRLATRTRVITGPPSHPEDAEAGVSPAGPDTLDLAVGHGRQAEAEHGAGVAGVDHAVVVDAAGEELRQGLGL